MSSPEGFGLKYYNGLMAVNVGDEARIKENLRLFFLFHIKKDDILKEK